MARADNPVRRDRAERVQAAILRVWENRGGETLSITRGARRLEFYRPPGVITGEDGEIIGVDAWVRLYNVNTGAEIRIDPHRRIINPPTVPRSGVRDVPDPTPEEPTRTRRELVVDAAEAFVEAVVDSIQDAPNPAGWRTAGTVTTVFGDTTDGYISSSNATYVTARSGSGTFTVNTTASSIDLGQSEAGGTYFLTELFLAFDTSGISDTDIVTAVELSMNYGGEFADETITTEAREFDWGATVTSGDWVAGASVGALPLMASITTTAAGASGSYKAFTSQAAFLTTTNLKTGTVRLLLHSDRFRTGNAPASGELETMRWTLSDNTGTTADPKLTITHNAPPATAPPMFRNRPARIWRRY